MKILSFAILTSLIFANARAAEVHVGTTKINLPPPAGFAQLTPDIQPLHDISMDMLAETNIRLATFVDEAVVPLALEGQTPEFDRYINVETMRDLAARHISQSDFDQLRNAVRRNKSGHQK